MFAEAFAEANEVESAKGENKKASQSEGKAHARNEQYSYENISNDAFYKDGRIYDYDFLVNQAPMQIITDMPQPSEVKSNGRIEPDHIAELGLKNAVK